jgi:hypothetical protein
LKDKQVTYAKKKKLHKTQTKMASNGKPSQKTSKHREKSTKEVPIANHTLKPKGRHEFRAGFRARAVFSFKRCILSMESAHSAMNGGASKSLAGFHLGDAYKCLGHSIEMFAKAILEQKSVLLILENLKLLDQVFHSHGEVTEASVCTGRVALARASKFFTMSLTGEQISILLEVVEYRNFFEHRPFAIKSLKGTFHKLARAATLMRDIYNRQFKMGNLASESDTTSVLKRFETEISDDFTTIQKQKRQLEKNGATFTRCLNCNYQLAHIKASGSAYNCLWCGDERVLRKCGNSLCAAMYWATAGDISLRCPNPHIELPADLSARDGQLSTSPWHMMKNITLHKEMFPSQSTLNIPDFSKLNISDFSKLNIFDFQSFPDMSKYLPSSQEIENILKQHNELSKVAKLMSYKSDSNLKNDKNIDGNEHDVSEIDKIDDLDGGD